MFKTPTLLTPFYMACFCFAPFSQAGAQALRHQDIEAVAASDVALYICAQAYPAGLAKMKVKIEQSLQDLAAPAAALRQAKTQLEESANHLMVLYTSEQDSSDNGENHL